MRYNRVEGLSIGLLGSEELGRGYTLDGTLRAGVVRTWPNLELGLSRSDGRHAWRLGGYRRLDAANDDWGNPLSFGASLGALLYGRDEGFYYHATGAELTRSLTRGGGLSTRFFVEQHDDAPADAEFNVSKAFGGGSRFQPNLPVRNATFAGIALRDQRTAGLNPLGWRLFSDLRAEGGWSSAKADGGSGAGSWVRAAGDVTITRGFGEALAAALSLGAGVSDGAPLERQFFVGGSRTVRGQLFATEAGPAYWLTRLELGRAVGPVRPVVFGDLGWAGARDAWQHPGRPLSGAGVGASVLDGLIRLDLSRGIYPRQKMRLDLYVDARF